METNGSCELATMTARRPDRDAALLRSGRCAGRRDAGQAPIVARPGRLRVGLRLLYDGSRPCHDARSGPHRSAMDATQIAGAVPLRFEVVREDQVRLRQGVRIHHPPLRGFAG